MGVKAVKLKFTNKPKEFWSNIKKIDENGAEEDAEELLGDQEPQYMEIEGVMSKENGTVMIIFDDSYLVGMRDSKVIFSFHESQPNAVMMVKTAVGNGAYVFDENKRRQMCSCTVGMFPFEFIVCTEDILNTITYRKGGTLTVDYTVEINGIPADGSKMSLKVEPIK